jgi:hypothetical protein
METAPNDIESLLTEAGNFIETRTELLKLKTVDKTADVVSSLVARLVVLMILGIFFMILNIGIALLVGEWLGKNYYGFFVVAGFYGIAGLICNTNKNTWIKKPLGNAIIQKILR